MEDYSEEEILEYKKAMKKYIFECAIMEGSKIIIFFIIFFLLDLIPQFLTALFFLMVVRVHGGGIHCKYYTTCLLVSTAVLSGSIYLGMYIPVYTPYSVITLIVSAVIAYRLVPIVSKNRPQPDPQQIKSSKMHTLTFIIVFTIVICICPYNQYINIGLWTIYIHIFQLLLAKLTQRRGKKCLTFGKESY